MDVIIFSGQSNMQGQTEGNPKSKAIKNAYEYLLYYNRIIPLRHPVGENFTCLSNDGFGFKRLISETWLKRGSMIPDFCKAYLKYSTCKELVAIQCAQGDTKISQWLKNGIDKERYDIVIKKITSGIKFVEENYEIEKIYFVWFHGGSDMIYRTDGNSFYNDLKIFKDDLFNDVKKITNRNIDKFCIIQNGYSSSSVKWVREYYKRLYDKDYSFAELEQQDELIQSKLNDFSNNKDCIMLSTLPLVLSRNHSMINPEAEGHYTNKAQKILGKSCALSLAKLRD